MVLQTLLSCGPPEPGTYVLYAPEQFRAMFRLGEEGFRVSELMSYRFDATSSSMSHGAKRLEVHIHPRSRNLEP